ncbi:MAG: hypothetical protein AB7D47_09095 [Desulfovibrio sp.]|jgi:hypothetical protein
MLRRIHFYIVNDGVFSNGRMGAIDTACNNNPANNRGHYFHSGQYTALVADFVRMPLCGGRVGLPKEYFFGKQSLFVKKHL